MAVLKLERCWRSDDEGRPVVESPILAAHDGRGRDQGRVDSSVQVVGSR